MKVVVTGASGVLGACAVPALRAAGHDVRAPRHRRPGVGVEVDLMDPSTLSDLLAGADTVVNLASRIPAGPTAAWSRTWRRHDRLRTRGTLHLMQAATRAGVRRVVQAGHSCLYADAGDRWIDETAPLDISEATDPLAVAEANVQAFGGGRRAGIVLRLGTLVGAVGTGRLLLPPPARAGADSAADGWRHLLHPADLGPAILAALEAPHGVYNVGAEPVRASAYAAAYEAAGGPGSTVRGRVQRRLAGVRLEPLGRSLRVTSARFTAATGWHPQRAQLGPDWLEPRRELAEWAS